MQAWGLRKNEKECKGIECTVVWWFRVRQALTLAKKNNSATISDLRNVNKIVGKIKKEENKVVYGRVGDKEKLQVIGVVDASYKSDEKSVGGMLIIIANDGMIAGNKMCLLSSLLLR